MLRAIALALRERRRRGGWYCPSVSECVLYRVPFSTTPSAPLEEASRILFDVASTPPISGAEWRTHRCHRCYTQTTYETGSYCAGMCFDVIGLRRRATREDCGLARSRAGCLQHGDRRRSDAFGQRRP